MDKPGVATPPRAELHDLVGQTILQFRVVERLGAGGMGVVYRAFDTKLRREVALKVLSARYLADDRNKELIFREARNAAALTDPNIAAIYDVHDVDGVAFIAMELVDGETLRARLARGRLDIDEAMRIGCEIARGLARAHAHGVVHRDLKPDNVMIARDGHVKLLDFGLAMAAHEAEPEVAGAAPEGDAVTLPARSPATRGRVMGTPAYMSPEQARGDGVDLRTDVFAFGAVLYELLVGTAPFTHRSSAPHEWTLDSGDWQARPPLRTVRRVPRALETIVSRCLDPDPERRVASAREIVDALSARPTSWGWAIAIAGLAVAAGIALWPRTRTADQADCSTAGAGVTTTWSSAARARYTSAASAAGTADDVRWFDRYASRLTGMLEARCVERASPPAVSALSRDADACLDRAARSLRDAIARPAAERVYWPELSPLVDCTAAGPYVVGRQPYGDEEPRASSALQPGGGRFVASSTTNEMMIHGLDGRIRATNAHCERVVRWLADGRIACGDDELELVDPDTGARQRIAGGRDVSPDGLRALVRDGGLLYVAEVADLSARHLVATLTEHERPNFTRFITNDTIAIPSIPFTPSTPAISVRLVSSSGELLHAYSFHLDAALRWPTVAWIDTHHALVGARNHADTRMGERLWRLTFDDAGELADPPEPIVAVDASWTIDVDSVADDHVLMDATVLSPHVELVHGGSRVRAPATMMASEWLRSYDDHRAVALLLSGGAPQIALIELPSWRTRLIDVHLDAGERLLDVSARGDRAVGLLASTSELVYFEIDAGGTLARTRVDLPIPDGYANRLLRCNAGHCLVATAATGTFTFAPISAAGLGERFSFRAPEPVATLADWNIAPDGRHLVVTSYAADDWRVFTGGPGGELHAVDDACENPRQPRLTGTGAVLVECSVTSNNNAIVRIDGAGRAAPVVVAQSEEYYNVIEQVDADTMLLGTKRLVGHRELLTLRRP